LENPLINKLTQFKKKSQEINALINSINFNRSYPQRLNFVIVNDKPNEEKKAETNILGKVVIILKDEVIEKELKRNPAIIKRTK
jgi:hypothetical protein